ncbi:hypothetical protein [Helicobacter pylori]|uniref:hypothetical protein n=1 Tax=Helicobacter pylori TaxID=210 RepID=UPI00165CB866|nr:hypothetical protein [Helicobacter pylori]
MKMWREAEYFATDENKKRITAILRKFKASKWHFSIFGADRGFKDEVIFTFHFDLRKPTQDWYQLTFGSFSEFFETIENRLKEARLDHDKEKKEQ